MSKRIPVPLPSRDRQNLYIKNWIARASRNNITALRGDNQYNNGHLTIEKIMRQIRLQYDLCEDRTSTYRFSYFYSPLGLYLSLGEDALAALEETRRIVDVLIYRTLRSLKALYKQDNKLKWFNATQHYMLSRVKRKTSQYLQTIDHVLGIYTGNTGRWYLDQNDFGYMAFFEMLYYEGFKEAVKPIFDLMYLFEYTNCFLFHGEHNYAAKFPVVLKLNKNGQPHDPNGVAIIWEDLTGIEAVNGVVIPGSIDEAHDSTKIKIQCPNCNVTLSILKKKSIVECSCGANFTT